MNLQGKLLECRREGKALLACNFYNYETLRSVCAAARELNAPIILQLTNSSIQYMGLNMAVTMAREALNQFDIEGWLHLDHGESVDLVQACLDAGFDSVMIDASDKPLEENISISKRVVKMAKAYGANVEAELGYVAKLGQEHDGSGFTDPNEAKYFVDNSGVDALAVAIGSAHGFYKKEPKLDLDLLSEICQATSVSLVLHGGSGIPDRVLQESIKCGIVKINLATEIKNMFMLTLKKLLKDNEEIDLRKVFPSAMDAVTELVKHKLSVVNNLKDQRA